VEGILEREGEVTHLIAEHLTDYSTLIGIWTSTLAISTDPKKPDHRQGRKGRQENQDQETELCGPETMSGLTGRLPFVSFLLPSQRSENIGIKSA